MKYADGECSAAGGPGPGPGPGPTPTPGPDQQPQQPSPPAQGSGGFPKLSVNEWVTIAVVLGVLALGFRKGTRDTVVRAVTGRRSQLPDPMPYPYPQPGAGGQMPPPMGGAAPPPLRTGPRPSLRGIAGQYAGSSFGLDTGPSTLGRDQRAVNLVFPPEANSISKVHCRVSWDAMRRIFLLEDLGSTNGTFLATGERLSPGQVRELRPGDRFHIGDMRNQFEVRLDP
jgi:hypothetical protein